MSTIRVALSTALLSAAVVPLTVAAPFTTGVANATAPSPTVVYVDDTDNDGFAGLVRATVAAPTATTPVIADDDKTDVVEAKLSPDGSRVAVVADVNVGTAADTGNLTLLTMNLDGTNRHVLANEADTATATAEFAGITWLGNSTVVYGWFHGTNAPTLELHSVSANGGAITVLPGTTGLADPAGSPDGSQIAAESFDGTTGKIMVLSAADTTSSVTAATVSGVAAYEPAWSPDGTAIAYVKDDSDPDPNASGALAATELDVVRNPGTGWGAPTVAVPVVKTPSSAWIDELPAWADNNTLYFDRFDISSSSAATASEDLWQAAFDTGSSTWGAATDLSNTANSTEWGVTVSPADVTAPSAVTFIPFVLGGTSVTVRWTSPDADYSHVTLHRTDTTAGTPTVDIPNVVGTSYVDKNLIVGHTYSYTADTFDGAGNQGPSGNEHAVVPTNSAKIVSVTPTAIGTPYLPFLLTWGVAGQPAGTKYDVDYTVKSGTTWALGATFHFATGTSATSGAFTKGVPGQTYYFRATVHDTHGNATSTSWTGVNVPLDQTAGTFSRGWTTIKNSKAYWLGSIAATSTNGTTYVVAPTSKSVSIIGTKCAACGKFAVYVDGHYRGTISTAASSTKFRQVLWTGINTAIGKHTIKLVAVLAAHQTLQIDAVADPR